ncbi:UDP-N-acetylmuramoyl-L-alanyl-D-glutamate--2,6-diaminopimelate ligase [Blattabacterium cuenoti]|uniref:UDP-N-acetylmuramoyl-L-alanyl-D-glutamate--2, 6-diaminopimelate ligase n=1 Tax=Blattabacterium cuenoti TaxID=1653831 RepID=UPI00163BD8E4|nr:UDP-N-acetylmuramoyl-L-alanyl-D-glutamate--2,6-diaminopimelate ligase [Blattabacterium cuenoti]
MVKTLKEVLKNVNILKIIGDNNLFKKVNGIFINSKLIDNNSIFIAKKGKKIDGHSFIQEAIQKGGDTIICETIPNYICKNITYIIVLNSVKALGYIAANFYDNPSKKIQLIGITGTNGKTSTAMILHKVFLEMGEKNILISTIGIRILYDKYPVKNTTPDIIDINKYLNLSLKKGCKYAFMEVSSHGIDQKRIFGLLFKGGIFTNITHDHLDYHKSFCNYLSIKKQFFDELPNNSFSLINIDDKNYSKIIKDTSSKIYFYGLKKKSDFKIKVLKKSINGSLLKIDKEKIYINLIGKFNIYNILASYATSILLGINKKKILKKLSKINPIIGRFEHFTSRSGVHIIVDYAHNPNGLKNIFDSINDVFYNNKIQRKLICVIGCGGNRDIEKRPIMGKMVYETCDISIFTSDNPRNEDPNNILMDMKNFLSHIKNDPILTFIDRKKAIQYAIKIAKKNDIIVIVGKGHENYQEIKGKFYPFNDMDIAKSNFF